MGKAYLNPRSVFSSTEHGFSQAVLSTAGNTLHLSGQVAWDAEKNLIGGDDLEAQARQAFSNVRDVMEEAGGKMTDIVSLRLYLVRYRPELSASVSSVLREFFPVDAMPASSWIGVECLAHPAFLIEVEAIAVLD